MILVDYLLDGRSSPSLYTQNTSKRNRCCQVHKEFVLAIYQAKIYMKLGEIYQRRFTNRKQWFIFLNYILDLITAYSQDLLVQLCVYLFMRLCYNIDPLRSLLGNQPQDETTQYSKKIYSTGVQTFIVFTVEQNI